MANKLIDCMVQDGDDALIFRLPSGNVTLIDRGDTLWVDINGRPACQIDLFHLSEDNDDSEKYGQIVLEAENGEDAVGYHRLLPQGNLTLFELGVHEKHLVDRDETYWGY